MKTSKKELFLNFIKTQHDWIDSSTLANYLNVSTRSIRKYVNEINSNGEFILSSKKGYKVNLNNNCQTKVDSSENISPDNRLNLILKELIVNSNGINIFDLSEELFVSPATIEGDIVKANKFIGSYNLKIKQSKFLLKLIGNESAKRKLMSSIIFKETGSDFLSLFDVQKIYQEYNLTKLKENIIYILKKYNLFINEYAINNILLHLMITIDRIKKNNYIESVEVVNYIDNNNDISISRDISNFLESEYNITLTSAELYYLVFQLTNKTTVLNYHEMDTKSLPNYIDDHFVKLTKKIIKNVYDLYLIDLSDEEFVVKFTLHVKNLISRAKNNQVLRNQIPQKLKDSYPLIYDISVYICNQIQTLENVDIDEDEISYISLHVGSFFDRQKLLEDKVLCALITPNYYDLQFKIVRDLEKRFNESIEIIQIFSDTHNLDFDNKVDMVITTLPINDRCPIPFVYVNPYLNRKDYDNIQSKFIQIKDKKNILTVQNHLEMYFSESLFMKNIYLDSAKDYIKFMGNILYENKYVKPNYIDDVLIREKMSSTAFNNNVAIPHSMKMDALKTGVCLIVNDKPVKWGEEKVQIIAMIPINEKEKEKFNYIFESFIEILSEWNNVKELTKADNYSSFMNRIAYLIQNI
ncbi:TPA: PTS sugar transporter subunit IIA [Clostridioides difficile]|uniref:Transcription antiterminator n=1 Tax=Clostridioides difficile ATCC 9689 = DSM 1296 TaxID=1121308 RepID=A0AC59G336_CLODI|nr:PTS sugar transporter subunit IIA [Clostridioides difficile]OFU23041.1 transcriptional antiterminator [Clostridium sp. HMSC19B12]AKP43987.1 transcription antiterminator [Clostridioides difficile ATCC 9689 = DSM 1296]AVI13525.1 PRD domain-containing protein [Clostridioides difficile]AVI58933.1 PRD domain-containing protein [Clostridioides difficile]AXU87983.1 transcription antiterminator [Clostridioides difficile]